MSGTEMIGTCTGSTPVYQWGRKDPLRPLDGAGGFKNCNSPTSKNPTYAAGPVEYKESILNPHVFYAASGWSSVCYANSWKQGAESFGYTGWDYPNEKKTIYDPCPPGFKVPHEYAFWGLTWTKKWSVTTDNKASDGNPAKNTTASDWRTCGAFDHGWHFYVDGKNDETLFFCANGWVSTDGKTIGEYDYCWRTWLGSAFSSGQGFDAVAIPSGIWICAVNLAGYGWQVRPIREPEWYVE
jgi:hypothetical protein